MMPNLTIKLLRIRNEIFLFATFLISLAALAGWFFNVPFLTGDFRNYIPIAPVSSIGFILISVSAFIIFRTRNKRLQLIALVALVIYFIIVVVILADHFFKLSLDIEKVFGKISVPFCNVRKGRISPVSAILFLVTLLSLFFNLSGIRYLKFYAKIIPILLLGFSFLIITGYVYNTPFLYSGNIIPMALPTGVCFFLISLVLINFFGVNVLSKSSRYSVIANRLANAFIPVSVLFVIVQGYIDAAISHTSANPALYAFIVLLVSIAVISGIIYTIAKSIGSSIEKIENEKLQIQTEKHEELTKKSEEYYALYEEYRAISEELYQKNEELTHSNRRIIDSELQYRRLFENMINGFAFCRMIFDEKLQPIDFVYLRVNSAFEKLTGLKNVTGKPVSEVIPDLKRTDPEIFNVYGRVTLSGKSEQFEIYVEALKMWFSVSVFSPEKEHFVAVFDVVTDRKRAEEQLMIAKEKAEESDRLKTAFLQNMSHEIRTPMNAIMGFSQLIPLYFENKQKLEFFSNIINQRCEDLLEIINEILDISKIESGQLPVKLDKCNVNFLLEDLYDFFTANKQKINKQEVQFTIKSVLDPSEIIVTDRVKLKQIFINLINNAFKFTEQGEIIAGCMYDANQQLVFYVSDTGIGISSENHVLIFERFFQVTQVGVFNKGGTGLGLAIVKGLIILLGGEIWLESQPGQGSKFYFSIPYKIETKPPDTIVVLEEKPNHFKFYNKTVLIVEDDYFNAVYLKEIFKDSGLQLLQTEFGKEAVKISVNQQVDIILMDIMLPDIDGYEATRLIKSQKPGIRIIAQTAYAGPDDETKCLNAGCDDYIRKPINRNQLLTKVHEQLSKVKT